MVYIASVELNITHSAVYLLNIISLLWYPSDLLHKADQTKIIFNIAFHCLIFSPKYLNSTLIYEIEKYKH